MMCRMTFIRAGRPSNPTKERTIFCPVKFRPEEGVKWTNVDPTETFVLAKSVQCLLRIVDDRVLFDESLNWIRRHEPFEPCNPVSINYVVWLCLVDSDSKKVVCVRAREREREREGRKLFFETRLIYEKYLTKGYWYL